MNRNTEHVAGQRHQFVQPQRLETDIGTKRLDLIGLRLGEIVVARDNGHRCVLHAWDCAQRSQHLDAAGQWHPQIKDDGMRSMSLRETQPFVGRMRSPHLEAFQAKHPRKQFCNADIVINDEDACVGGARRHWLIVVLECVRVKCSHRARDLTVWAPLAFVLYSGASVGMSRLLGLPVPARSGGEGRHVYPRRRFC